MFVAPNAYVLGFPWGGATKIMCTRVRRITQENPLAVCICRSVLISEECKQVVTRPHGMMSSPEEVWCLVTGIKKSARRRCKVCEVVCGGGELDRCLPHELLAPHEAQEPPRIVSVAAQGRSVSAGQAPLAHPNRRKRT